MLPTDEPEDGAVRPPAGRRGRLRALDRRTVAICVCVALLAALAAGLVASFVISDDDARASTGLSLTRSGDVDDATVLTTRLFDFEGRATSLGAIAGKGTPVVLNFFSSTCPPCIREMPAFEKVHRSGPPVRFVGINVQDEIGPARQLVRDTGITYDTLRDPPGDLLRSVKASALPTTVLLNGKGHIVDRYTGALTEDGLRSLIERKLF